MNDAERSQFCSGRNDILEQLATSLETRAFKTPLRYTAVSLIVTDVEGCVNYDTHTYDFEVIDSIRRLYEQFRAGTALPGLSLCTGRQAAYVEAISAFLGIKLPSIFEGGCGLFFPERDPGDRQIVWHPRVEEARKSGELKAVRDITLRVAQARSAQYDIGKARLITFHAASRYALDALHRDVSDALGAAGLHATVARSANALDVSVAGVNKGTAIPWLLEEIQELHDWDLNVEQLVGIGDSQNDLSFMKATGRSVCPSNASDIAKAVAGEVSMFSDVKAVAHVILSAIQENLEC